MSMIIALTATVLLVLLTGTVVAVEIAGRYMDG